MPHINDKVDFTAEVFIVYKNKVLLRMHDKYNLWLGVGGHIELDEDPNQAAIREVKEEVGLDVTLYTSLNIFKNHTATYKELIPPYFMNRHRINDTHEHVTLIYFATADTYNILQQSDKEKSVDCRWFTRGEIEERNDIIEWVKQYALKALDETMKD